MQSNRRHNKSNFRNANKPGSLVLSSTAYASSRISWSLENGLASSVLCGKEKVEGSLHQGLIGRIFQKIHKQHSINESYRKATANGMEESEILHLVSELKKSLLQTKIRFVGIAGLFFSLYVIGGFLLNQYTDIIDLNVGISDFAVGIITFFVSACLLFSRGTIAEKLRESRLFGRIFVGMLGIDPESVRVPSEGKTSSRAGVAFALGTVGGILSLIMKPGWVLLAVAAILYGCVAFAVPEMSLLTAIVIFPIASDTVMFALTILTGVSYLVKLFRMKRVLHGDVPVLLMGLTVLSAFLVSWTSGSYDFAWKLLMYGILWVLASNLMKTKTLFRKYVAGFLYGGILVLLLSGSKLALTYFRFDAVLSYLPEVALSEEVVSGYLILLTPVALMHGTRWSGIAAIALILANCFFLQSGWVFLGIYIAALLYIAVSKRAPVGVLLVAFITIPMYVFAFSGELGGFGFSNSSVMLALAKKYWYCGVGEGQEAVRIAALSNGWIPDEMQCNLYIKLLVEGGIVYLLLFLASGLLSLQYAFTGIRNSVSQSGRSVCSCLAVGIVGYLLLAAFFNIESGIYTIGIFWCLCAGASQVDNLYGKSDLSIRDSSFK